MNTNISELSTQEMETIQAGRGSIHVGYTIAIAPELQQLHETKDKRFEDWIHP
jgi:hypothetical protein